MSWPHSRASSTCHKREFRSASQARKYVRHCPGDARHGRYPYRCPNGDHWHLTSTRQAA